MRTYTGPRWPNNQRLLTGEVEYLAAVSDDDTPALLGGAEPFAYYGTDRSTSHSLINLRAPTSSPPHPG